LILLGSAQSKNPPSNSKIGPVRELAGDPNDDAYMVMQISNIWSAMSNFGNYGDPNAPQTGLPSGQWPAGSGNDYVWEGRFWIASLVQGKKRVSHADYGDYEFHSSGPPVDPFFLGAGISIQDSRVTFDDLQPPNPNPNHYSLGLRIHQTALTWSMPDYDDFIAIQYQVVNTSANTLSNLYVAWVFDNDVATLDPLNPNIDDDVDYDGWDGTDSQTDEQDWVDPLDLDNDGQDGYDEWGIPYGWSNPDNPNYTESLKEPDGVYDEYQIYLDPNGPVILGQAGDWAGNPLYYHEADGTVVGDTLYLHGWLISRDMSIIYDGDDNAAPGNDTGERSLPVPCDGWTGGRLIYTPHAPYYTAPDDTLPRPFAHQWWNWNSDPGNDDEKFDYMAASHQASLGYHFIPNPREIGAPVFDYRWLTSTGPFTVAPGDTLRFVYALCLDQGLKGVRAAADQAMGAYYEGAMGYSPSNPGAPISGQNWVLPVPPPIPNLNYTGVNGGVSMAWDNHAEYELDPLLGYSDFEGYKIYRAAYAPSNWHLIYACDNLTDSLVYVVTTEGDTVNPRRAGDSAFVLIDLPDITHSFMDDGGNVLFEGLDTLLYDPDTLLWGAYDQPVNAVPYYYVLVAYDSYKPATPNSPEFMPQESSRSNYLKDPGSGAPMAVYPLTNYGEEENPDPSSGVFDDVQHVIVVPNPYRGTNLFEARYESVVKFMNLPPACKITILTLAGDIVRVLDHNSGTNEESWDLLSMNTQAVVSGLYIYVAETTSDKTIGKFVIAR
jgi:hypothetical protein